MAVYDLYTVTNVFLDLIKQGFAHSPAWSGVPNVVGESPESLTTTGISFYLYHSLEKKEHANFPVPGSDKPTVRFLPMGLTLYYQLSANSKMETGTPSHTEQLMMSIAMKTLHDFPVIDDNTLDYNQNPVLPTALTGKNNRFQVIMQPVPYTDAVHNWTAGTLPLKFSAYYEVYTIFLEPEDTTHYTGRVLVYGNYVLAGRAPRLTGSQSVLFFSLPGETLVRQVTVQPAQAAPGQEIIFFGTGFSADELQLRLFNPRWSYDVVADDSWAIHPVGANQLAVSIGTTATKEDDGSRVVVLPGVYSAQVATTNLFKLPNGQTKELKSVSNQFPFTVSPSITTITPPVLNLSTITGYIFQHALLNPTDIDVYINDTRMNLYPGGVYSPGQFKILNASQIEVNLPSDIVPGVAAALRILVAGAESAPNWITV